MILMIVTAIRINRWTISRRLPTKKTYTHEPTFSRIVHSDHYRLYTSLLCWSIFHIVKFIFFPRLVFSPLIGFYFVDFAWLKSTSGNGEELCDVSKPPKASTTWRRVNSRFYLRIRRVLYQEYGVSETAHYGELDQNRFGQLASGAVSLARKSKQLSIATLLNLWRRTKHTHRRKAARVSRRKNRRREKTFYDWWDEQDGEQRACNEYQNPIGSGKNEDNFLCSTSNYSKEKIRSG